MGIAFVTLDYICNSKTEKNGKFGRGRTWAIAVRRGSYKIPFSFEFGSFFSPKN